MSQFGPLVLYDIVSPLKPRSYAPNPSKARLALSFKKIPFTTEWVEILDIPELRKGLSCQATRKLDDGSDYFTLPMLQDPSSGKILGDSFDIAVHLDEAFPEAGAGRLFPPGSTRTGLDYESPSKDTVFYAPITTNAGSKYADYAHFNLHVDTTFSANMAIFGYYLPFNPPTADATKAVMAKRAHLTSWEDLKIEGEAREPLRASFKEKLTSLAQLFKIHDGPYLEGEQANYADLIVGGWLNFLSTVIPKDEWEEFRTWHDGVFARLHDALQKNYFVCQ
jgi:glutathione S-transferase